MVYVAKHDRKRLMCDVTSGYFLRGWENVVGCSKLGETSIINKET